MMDCKLKVNYLYKCHFNNFNFRWHRIEFIFQSNSIRFQFDDQFNYEIELPLNYQEILEIFTSAKIAVLGANSYNDNQTDFIFKVNYS